MYTVMHGSTAHGASGFVDKFVELSIDKKQKSWERNHISPSKKKIQLLYIKACNMTKKNDP